MEVKNINTNTIGLIRINHNNYGFYDTCFLGEIGGGFLDAIKYANTKAFECLMSNRNKKFNISVEIITGHGKNGDNVYEVFYSVDNLQVDKLNILRMI